jgi:hypothetical protein
VQFSQKSEGSTAGRLPSFYFFRQKDAKMDPKSNQNGTNNHPKTGFLRLLGVLEEDVFSRFLETKKIGPKSGNIRKKTSKGRPIPVK